MPGQDIESEPSNRPVGATPEIPRTALILGAAGRTLITAGIVVFLFVGFQLWGTGVQEAKAQNSLSSELEDRIAAADNYKSIINSSPEATVDVATSTTSPDSEISTETTLATETTTTVAGGYDPDILALFFPENGDALARMEMPAIGVDKVVVRGIDVADLRKGPGHYPTTVLPGYEGNSSIAGHRTTYGAPFNRIDELIPGDIIKLTGVQGEFTYRVLDPKVAYAGYEDEIDGYGAGHILVKPSATWVLGDFGDNRLTLTACHPKLSARQRIIVAAELVGEPVRIPTWAEEAAKANAALASETPLPDLGAADITTTSSAQLIDASPSTSISLGSLTLRDPQAGDLDRGLNGERGAIPGAILWILGAMIFWIGAGHVGRRRTKRLTGRIGYRLAGLVPAAIFLWNSFEMIDRALPAY